MALHIPARESPHYPAARLLCAVAVMSERLLCIDFASAESATLALLKFHCGM